MVVNHEQAGQAVAGLARRLWRLRRQRSVEAQADHALGDGRHRHASFLLRRPLSLRLADARRLCRQRHGHLRPEESRRSRSWSGTGTCRGSGPPAARRRPGRRRITAAIIRCGSATGSTPATGRAASSSSTSRTCAKPKFVSGLDWSPPFPCPTHRAIPVPFEIGGRKILLVADEDVMHQFEGPPAFLWVVDITQEDRPVPFASFQVEELDGTPAPKHSAATSRSRRSPAPKFPPPGSCTACASSTSAARARRRRSRASCRTRRRASIIRSRTTCSWTTAG